MNLPPRKIGMIFHKSYEFVRVRFLRISGLVKNVRISVISG